MYESALSELTAPRRLKRELPIPWVLEQAGVRMELVGGALSCRCPFHPDQEPSFSVTDGGECGWRWVCWPCGQSGDVLDLMKMLWPVMSFNDCVAAGLRGVDRIRETGWVAPKLEGTGEFDNKLAREMLTTARSGPQDSLEEFVAAKGAIYPADWLTAWDVTCLSGELLVPVYSRDRELVGLKHRRSDASDHLFAFPGSRLGDALYGETRYGGVNGVLLVEGESDAWTASWLLRGRLDVLSVATGAGSSTRPADRLRGREVHVCFDGDDAGRAGGARWAAATDGQQHLMPSGYDLSSYVQAGGSLSFLP